jgi:hypothetical protein
VGDLLLAFLLTSNTAAVTASAGWALIAPSPTTGSTTVQINSYIRIATNTAEDNFKGEWTGSVYAAADVMRLTGARRIAAVDASDADNSGTSTEPEALSLTTNGPLRLLVMVEATFTGGLTHTAPAGFTKRIATNGVVVYTAEQAVAGASGAKKATLSSSSVWAAHMFALFPGQAPPFASRAARNSLLRR